MSNGKRYIRVPIPLKKKVNKRKLLLGIIEKHKMSIEREKAKLHISDYALHWIQFIRGFLIALIVERLILH